VFGPGLGAGQGDHGAGRGSKPTVIVTHQAIHRGGFTSAKEPIASIRTFIDGWNDRYYPFTWTKNVDQILDHCKPGQRTPFT
jgi:hypothetical protein